MRRPAVIAFATTVLCGLLAAVVVAATDSRSLAFTLGVQPAAAIAIPAHGTACQTPIDVSTRFERVDLTTASTSRRSGPALRVTIARVPSGVPIGRGAVPAGYRGRSLQRIDLHRSVAAGQRIAVCLTNDSRHMTAVGGNSGLATRDSTMTLDGKPRDVDLAFVFERDHPTSVLSLLPTMFSRAAEFKLRALGAWTFWLLLAGIVSVVPLLLGRALHAAAGSPGDESRSDLNGVGRG